MDEIYNRHTLLIRTADSNYVRQHDRSVSTRHSQGFTNQCFHGANDTIELLFRHGICSLCYSKRQRSVGAQARLGSLQRVVSALECALSGREKGRVDDYRAFHGGSRGECRGYSKYFMMLR